MIESMDTIAMNLTATNENTYANNEAILFDKVTLKEGNISYNTDKKAIVIGESGIYFVNWYLNVSIAGDFSFIAYTLKNQRGENVCSCGISYGITVGQVPFTIYSNQLFEAKVGDELSLLNESAGDMKIFQDGMQSGNLSITLLSGGSN